MTPQDYVNIGVGILATFGTGGVLAAVLPQGKPGTAWGTVRAVIDILAQNYGNAKNAPKA